MQLLKDPIFLIVVAKRALLHLTKAGSGSEKCLLYEGGGGEKMTRCRPSTRKREMKTLVGLSGQEMAPNGGN